MPTVNIFDARQKSYAMLLRMTYAQLIKHFQGVGNAAKAIGMTRQCLYEWKMQGKIPYPRQLYIQEVSGGKLKAVNGKG